MKTTPIGDEILIGPTPWSAEDPLGRPSCGMRGALAKVGVNGKKTV